MFRCLNHEVDAERPEPGEVADHIARAAARLFANRGFDATSVREIVAEAGVTKPTLYYHYGSKEGLGQALLSGPVTGLVDGIAALAEAPMGPLERQSAILDAQFDFFRAEPDRARFMFGLIFGPKVGSLADGLQRIISRMDGPHRRAAEGLVDAGLISGDRLDAWVVAVKGLAMAYMMQILYRGVDPGPGLADRLVGDLLEGFGVAVGTDRSRPR